MTSLAAGALGEHELAGWLQRELGADRRLGHRGLCGPAPTFSLQEAAQVENDQLRRYGPTFTSRPLQLPRSVERLLSGKKPS